MADKDKYEYPQGKDPAKERKSIEYYFKMTVVFGGVIIVLGVILGSYLWNLIFDPDHFNLEKWLERVIICVVIMLTMMVLGFIDLDATLRSSKKSEYTKRRESFNEEVGSIYENDTVVYFDQFIPWNAERELREKKIRYLAARGIPTADAEMLIDYANEADLPHISGINPDDKPSDKKGEDLVKTIKQRDEDGTIREIDVIIPAIMGTQVAYVQDMLSGTVAINVEDPSYYLTDSKTRDSGKTSLERASATEAERRRYLRKQFITKALASVVFSLIFSLLAPDTNSDMSEAEKAWVLVQRLASAIGGFGSGALAGIVNVAYVTRWIADKQKVVSNFIAYLKKGEFVPLTREEIKNKKMKEYRRRQQEARDAVVDPEAVEQGEIAVAQLMVLDNK